jgi:ankyrin repeat protein
MDEDNYQKIIFEFITIQKWDSVENILTKKIIDPDIRDSAGNYLIHLLIYYNQIDLLKLLLKLEPRLDIIDPDGKQICYLPIRYNQIDILKLLLEYNKINYGIDITNFRDSNQLSPLFYASKFNSDTSIKLLLDNGARLDVTDKSKNTVLHLACLTGKDEQVKILSNYYPEMKLFINSNKQTPLHSAILGFNIKIIKIILQDENKLVLAQDENDRTPLMYAIEFQNTNCCEELLTVDNETKNILMDLVDVEGNTHYHLAIKFKLNLDLFIIPSINAARQINVEGNTILHLILLHNLKNYFPEILKISSLIIQNNDHNTSLHLLMPKMWVNYISILETKKLSIFLKNKNGDAPLDLVESKDKDKFINVVTNSYYNLLISNPEDEYINEWENNCSKKKLDSSNCKKEILDTILNKNISYPMKKKNYCINVTSKMVTNSSYLGITVDIIGGLMELNNKFNVITSLSLGDIVHNPNLSSFYKNNRIIRDDFLNFEIIWSYQTIFFPIGLDILFKNFLKSKTRYFVIPVGIELAQGSHANMLIYDKKYNELERFEPDGSKPPNGFYYFPDELDTYIYQYFSKLLDQNDSMDQNAKLEYQKPIDSDARISFQRYENLELNTSINRGYCGAWSAWYTYQRIRTGIKMNKLIPKLLQKIRGSGLSFKQIVRNYASIMSNNRDILFKKINISIDDWFIHLTNEQLVKLSKFIK